MDSKFFSGTFHCKQQVVIQSVAPRRWGTQIERKQPTRETYCTMFSMHLTLIVNLEKQMLARVAGIALYHTYQVYVAPGA